jgi:hypothetical protein
MRPSRIPLPAPLRSTPVTAFHRYYERSDSCAGGSSAPCEHEHRPDPAQVSLRPVPCRHDHSVSTHQTCPGIAFTRYPSADTSSPPDRWVEISPVPGRLIAHVRPFRVRSYGLVTPPSIAPHLASRRRSYRWVRAGERMPEEDFHLSVMAPLQAHPAGPAYGRRAQRELPEGHEQPLPYWSSPRALRSLPSLRELVVTSNRPPIPRTASER